MRRKCTQHHPGDRFPSGPCRICSNENQRRYRSRNANRIRARRFGITEEDLDALYAVKGPSCWSCGLTETEGQRRLCVDHDHTCCPWHAQDKPLCGKCVRGLLCTRCNTLLGTLEREQERLQKLAVYQSTFMDY